MSEVLHVFFTSLGIIWFFLIVLKIIATRNQLVKDEENNLQDRHDNVIYAVAEYVEQGSFKGWLLFDKTKKDFLAQGETKESINEMLKLKYPGKTFFIEGFYKE